MRFPEQTRYTLVAAFSVLGEESAVCDPSEEVRA